MEHGSGTENCRVQAYTEDGTEIWWSVEKLVAEGIKGAIKEGIGILTFETDSGGFVRLDMSNTVAIEIADLN